MLGVCLALLRVHRGEGKANAQLDLGTDGRTQGECIALPAQGWGECLAKIDREHTLQSVGSLWARGQLSPMVFHRRGPADAEEPQGSAGELICIPWVYK